jgi:uncharacterized membrane protein (UPF0127 family)
VTSVASVKKISGAVFAALLSFSAWQSWGAQAEALEKHPLSFITSSGKHAITVEVADEEQERNLGLMFRRSLGDDEGMIFLYKEEQIITMWMKNTYLPLDMIFVRKDGIIHRIERDTEPFSESVISSGAEVLAVIEMKAGSAGRLGLKPGDKVDYPVFR